MAGDGAPPREFAGVGAGWFSEVNEELWPGVALSLRARGPALYSRRSALQQIDVFESDSFGRVLLLDGVIQLTTRDEFSYQEMITHLPLCSLPASPGAALSVCVIGGGDGGVLRECCRHARVGEVHLCEIDEEVISVSKRFFPGLSAGAFEEPRVRVHVRDGKAFLAERRDRYDAVIVDSSDPVGPAQALFEREFYEIVHAALRPGGVACVQAESVWLHLDLIARMRADCARVFGEGNVRYAYTTIPTYPSGQIGFMLLRKGGGVPAAAAAPPPEGLRYYTPEVHAAAFALPKFARDALGGGG